MKPGFSHSLHHTCHSPRRRGIHNQIPCIVSSLGDGYEKKYLFFFNLNYTRHNKDISIVSWIPRLRGE
jgi:hypothetical protein